MANLIENMAYVGQTPRHGLGNQLTQQQPIVVWAKHDPPGPHRIDLESRLDWRR